MLPDEGDGHRHYLDDEVRAAGHLRVLPRLPVQHRDLRDSPVHGHQVRDDLTRAGQHICSYLTNNTKLFYEGMFRFSRQYCYISPHLNTH